MAAQVPFKKIRLDENEIPGGQLPNSVIDANSAEVLRRFLKVRGVRIPSNSNKKQLVELVRSKVAQKIEPTVDKGVWLQRKVLAERSRDINAAAERLPDNFDSFPILGWKQFPSVPVPVEFDDASIYKHVIQSAIVHNNPQNADSTDDESENVTPFATGKSLTRGRRYFLDGHVTSMMDALSQKNHYCLKAEVRASMNKQAYKVCIMLQKVSGEILDASCQCKASGMSRCSHICGLLIALQDYTTKFGFTPPACTSVVCSWNKGRKEKNAGLSYSNQYTDKRDPSRAMKEIKIQNGAGEKSSNNLLYLCQVKKVSNGWSTVLAFSYADYDLSPEREAELMVLATRLTEALKFGFAVPQSIPETEKQAQCDKWHTLRTLLITASKFSEFLTSENVSRKLTNLLWEPKKIANKYMDHGIENEETARETYRQCTRNEVVLTGLWVNPAYPGLACSPDGIVTCSQTLTKGLLEIKCTYLLRDYLPTDTERLNKNQKSSYILKKEGGSVRINRNHKWYRQMQMQMGVTNYQWCDFALWTRMGIYIERIQFDSSYWNEVSARLLDFHWSYVCPEYFENRLPRSLQPFKLRWPKIRNEDIPALSALCLQVLQ